VSSQGDNRHTIRGGGRHATKTLSSGSVSTRQHRIAHIAGKYSTEALTTLAHHIDMAWMHEAFSKVKRKSTPGVDGVTVTEYAEDLDARLGSLLSRMKDGSYRVAPVKLAHIPKNETEMRTIGMPTVERKVMERAVQMALEPLYETAFLESSHGFRPRRSVHTALDDLRGALKDMGGGYVLDVDIRNFFGSIPHAQLREILGYRVKDRVIARLIHKCLKAGVWEDEVITFDDEGVPQGGVLSPLMSNVFLHVVLDEWLEREIKPRLRGRIHMVRFADDFVIVCEDQHDAERVMAVLPKRFARYGLQIHPDKTRLIDFRHPWRSDEKPGTFDFLGFTFLWGRTRKGGYAVMRKTSAKSMRKCVRKVHQWCKANRHKPLGWQHAGLCGKLVGHYAHYGKYGNSREVGKFHYLVKRKWQYWLNRRSRKRDGMPWKRFASLTNGRYKLPDPRIRKQVYGGRQQCLVI